MSGYPDARGGRTLGANFTAKTFIYLGDVEPATPAPGPKAAAPKVAGGAKKESVE